MDKDNFAKLLCQFRSEAGLSYSKFECASGVDATYLWELENEKKLNPTRDIIFRLALGLRLDCEQANELLIAAKRLPLKMTLAGKSENLGRPSDNRG